MELFTETERPSKFKIIRNKNEWDSIVERCDFSDCYHTYDYHQLSRIQGEEPILVCYSEMNRIIALPLLLRSIEDSAHKDATSVYGYPGPITKNIAEDFDFSLFQKELYLFLHEQKIVSVFSRLNPFIPYQETCLKGLGRTESPGKLVYIDLTKTLDDQLTAYHRRLRTYINKSRSVYTIKKSNSIGDLEGFIELYYENMKRVNAKDEYFFNKRYFIDLMNSSSFESELMLAISNETGDVAGGAIFIKKDRIIQYHLSGAGEKYLPLNPIKLLIDEVRIKGTQEGYAVFNLGGGFGSKEDSLFYFKSGFSKDSIPFKVWKYIVNKNIYEDLVRQKIGVLPLRGSSHFFPFYRHKT